jgi:hypothetical protein
MRGPGEQYTDQARADAVRAMRSCGAPGIARDPIDAGSRALARGPTVQPHPSEHGAISSGHTR